MMRENTKEEVCGEENDMVEAQVNDDNIDGRQGRSGGGIPRLSVVRERFEH